MIATNDALSTFNRMLQDAGFDLGRPDPQIAWGVFKEFGAMPVDAATDGLLFQCGTYSFTGETLFEFDLTRQFTRQEGEEEVGMEQLSCTIYFAPTAELDALTTNIWSFGFPSLGAFFKVVEALPEFRVPISGQAALRAETRQEDI